MKPKTTAKSPIPTMPGSVSTNDAGAASTLKPAGASDPSSFLWETCTELMERDRVDIKQQAVLDGLRLGGKICQILRCWNRRQGQGPGTEEFTDWVDQFDATKERCKIPHSTVGLIGALGSGKSTLLNAILDQRDLLPPSNDRAGTAAACKVVYGHDLDGYRARVLFRSRQSFTDDLDKLFKNLKEKRELQASKAEASGDAEKDEIEDQLEDIDTNTSDTLGLLHVLCGVKEEGLGVVSTEEFLDAHPLRFLGTTEQIDETDHETFLAKTKPFMDSTPSDWDGEQLVLWPLIDHVTIFVKSDVLKYGIELVDLPGLGDAVESRSRVAERFSQSLDITAIVAPAIRATEEKAVIGFINKRQEHEMRMNGKFDRNSLCVIISKSEDMDVSGYLASSWIAKKYPDISGYLDRAKVLGQRIRASESELGGLQPETLTYNTTTTPGTMDNIATERQELLTLRDSLKQAAVSIRNRVVSERIQEEFRGRQGVTKPTEEDQFHAGTVKVFPTSARAFQEIRHPGGMKKIGFRTERHTGIPQLKQWLVEVTLKKREKHLNSILNQLFALFIRTQTWVSMSKSATPASQTGLRDLDSIHQKHHRLIDAILRLYGERIRQIQPLKAWPAVRANCQREYPGKIDRWGYRYPDKTGSTLKIFGGAQKCILRKHGEHHRSSGKYSYNYRWIDDLASVFTETMSKDCTWQYTFSEVVPGYEHKIEDSLEYVWERYLTSLESFCVEHDVSSLRHAGTVQQVLKSARVDLGININLILTELKTGAEEIHPIFRNEIKRIMMPLFDEAYSINGDGCVRKRSKLMKQFAAENSADMPVKAYEKMEVALAELIRLHAGAIEGLAGGVVTKVERQMKLLLGGSLASFSPTALGDHKELVEEISPHLASWKVCWQKPSNERDDHVMRGDFSIPDPELLKTNSDESSAYLGR